MLRLIPDLRDVLLLIAPLLPLFEGETTLITVDWSQIVPFQDAFALILDCLFLRSDVHWGDPIDLLHQLDQIDCAKIDQLVDSGYDILVSS